jgi:hypothetical protein
MKKVGAMPERNTVFDVDGKIYSRLAGANRLRVSLDEVSPLFIDALLARDDTRFYQHPGVDWRGIFRALETFARHDIKATINVCGILAERYPDIVRRIHDDGHDVVSHSYAMDIIPIYLTEDEERANIRRTTDLLQQATGVKPRGWISPRSTPSQRTPRLLLEAGYDWHGDTLNDDLPYVVKFGDRSIVAFPNNTEVNDLPIYMKHGNSPRVMLEMFEDWLAYARTYERGAARMDPAIHTHVFGRPAGMAVFQRIMEIAKAADDIWIGTRSQAAAHLRATLRM